MRKTALEAQGVRLSDTVVRLCEAMNAAQTAREQVQARLRWVIGDGGEDIRLLAWGDMTVEIRGRSPLHMADDYKRNHVVLSLGAAARARDFLCEMLGPPVMEQEETE